MLSSSDLERIIAVKKLEIEQEKIQLGLMPLRELGPENDKENTYASSNVKKQVSFRHNSALCERNDDITEKKEKVSKYTHQELDQKVPPDLERYIRRYLGLPVMLRAGEYSPNNPLIRSERVPGDVLLGLGEYERQRNTLRRIRQQQYREYLDQQAKKKQEAKEQAERERREREEREREREQRERELLLERDKHDPERRCLEHVPVTSTVYCNNMVDTAVQVDGFSCPLSVAVQTDYAEMFRDTASPSKSLLTEAERELSPRTVVELREKVAWPVDYTPRCHRRKSYGDFDESSTLMKKSNRDKLTSDLRHSHMLSIFDADAIQLRNLQAEKEAAERRQYYQRELKNQILEQQRIREERKKREKMLEQAEMRRLEEQLRMLRTAQEQELGKQRRISAAMEENTTEYNNKLAELQKEIDKEQHKLLRATSHSTNNSRRTTSHSTNNSRRTTSSRNDNPSQLPSYPTTYTPHNPYSKDLKPYLSDNSTFSSNYDVDSYLRRNLNFDKDKLLNKHKTNSEIDNNGSDYNIKKVTEGVEKSPNFTDRLISNYNVDKTVYNRPVDFGWPLDKYSIDKNIVHELPKGTNDDNEKHLTEKIVNGSTTSISKCNIDKVIGHDRSRVTDGPDGDYEPSSHFNNYPNSNHNIEKSAIIRRDVIDNSEPRNINIRPIEKPSKDQIDSLPIPVLRHTPGSQGDGNFDTNLSDKMKMVDDKWKVPAVQKNILKSSSDDGKNISILTQLGSIRRQLQLEQLKLDKMLSENDT